MYIYSFEKLEVWVEAKEFAKVIYQITSSFPYSEKFELNALRNYQLQQITK